MVYIQYIYICGLIFNFVCTCVFESSPLISINNLNMMHMIGHLIYNNKFSSFNTYVAMLLSDVLSSYLNFVGKIFTYLLFYNFLQSFSQVNNFRPGRFSIESQFCETGQNYPQI